LPAGNCFLMASANIRAHKSFATNLHPLTLSKNDAASTRQNLRNNVIDNSPVISSTATRQQDEANGPGIPGLVPVPAPDPIPDVGAFSGPPFPATVADLRLLTELQLHELSAFYNDIFGIIPGDALDEKLTKFQAYILGV
jgi:hypothetical protein